MRAPAGPVDATFHELLNGEVLRSERRRVLSLAGLLTAILIAIHLLRAFAPGFVGSIFHGPVPSRAPMMIFPPFIAYELAVAAVLTYLARRGRSFPTFGRYANALVETSFPTLGIYALIGYLDPPVAFSSWPALLYFLFIILSTLRLDFVLSAFTGAVAAVELFALAYFERALAAASARDRVTNLFGQRVSPQVVDQLLAIGAAELSEMRRVCVMFVDIRGFTAAAGEAIGDAHPLGPVAVRGYAEPVTVWRLA